MSNRLNEFFFRTYAFFHETHPNKQRFPIVIALAVIFLLTGCGDNVSATNQPNPTPTPTEFPIFYNVTPTPERSFTTEMLRLGDRLELITTEGQPADGKGVVVIEVMNWIEDSMTWEIEVKSNITPGVDLRCTFGDWLGLSCRGELSAMGEIWPNSEYITKLNNKGITLEGTKSGVKVEYDARWWRN